MNTPSFAWAKLPGLLSAATAILLATVPAQATPVPSMGTWTSTLQARDINGQPVALDSAQASFFYDSTLNLTWLTPERGEPLRSWHDAKVWAATLMPGGFTGWRLPLTADLGAPGCQFSYVGTDCGFNPQWQGADRVSEMAHLYYVTLGNLAPWDLNGVKRVGSLGVDFGLINTGPFRFLQGGYHWSEDGFEDMDINNQPVPRGWAFDMLDGMQAGLQSDGLYRAMAVRPGDVFTGGGQPVPAPGSLVLAVLGLGLLASTRRQARAAPLRTHGAPAAAA